MLNIYIGWDQREAIAWNVLAHSIITRTSEPVNLVPLRQETLRQCGMYWREKDALASTDFSLTRFLVPYLSNYEGYSLFLDCDMLCQADIHELFTIGYRDPSKSVWVVQHDYTPKATTKMDGQTQTTYPRKNWSSVMLFNNAACRSLTPQAVRHAAPSELHQLQWTPFESIGQLSTEWNWLIGEYRYNPSAKLAHYTLGGPWFKTVPVDTHGEQWVKEYYAMTDRYPHFLQMST